MDAAHAIAGWCRVDSGAHRDGEQQPPYFVADATRADQRTHGGVPDHPRADALRAAVFGNAAAGIRRNGRRSQ